MKITFKDLKVGDWIKIPYLDQEHYVTEIDRYKKVFRVSSLAYMPEASIEITQYNILVENNYYDLLGVSVPAKHNILKRIFCKMFLHPVKKRAFTDTELRLMELLKTNP